MMQQINEQDVPLSIESDTQVVPATLESEDIPVDSQALNTEADPQVSDFSGVEDNGVVSAPLESGVRPINQEKTVVFEGRVDRIDVVGDRDKPPFTASVINPVERDESENQKAA